MSETLQMLTPKDIAGILGVHQKTVHLWLRNGKLKGIKISYRAWRIPKSALDEFIEQNSNVVPQKGTEVPATGVKDKIPEEPVQESPAVIPDTPQVKMKHYLQDIMAEQAPETDKSR